MARWPLLRRLAVAASAVWLASSALLGACQPAGRARLPRVILQDGQMPTPFSCAAPACAELPIDGFRCDARAPLARTVVVSGHSLPPVYLDQTPRTVAQAIACLDPDLVILDTCFGFSTPLLEALAEAGVTARVVGSRRQVPGAGLTYGPAFFTDAGPRARGDAVRWETEPLDGWEVDAGELAAALALTQTWGPAELQARLQRVHPNLVNVPLGAAGATALALVPPERFRPAVPAVRPGPPLAVP